MIIISINNIDEERAFQYFKKNCQYRNSDGKLVSIRSANLYDKESQEDEDDIDIFPHNQIYGN